ncbi:MAG: hypothetical protein AAF283_12895 [Cyanobacteria bacterium P01_A01_bin.70]
MIRHWLQSCGAVSENWQQAQISTRRSRSRNAPWLAAEKPLPVSNWPLMDAALEGWRSLLC